MGAAQTICDHTGMFANSFDVFCPSGSVIDASNRKHKYGLISADLKDKHSCSQTKLDQFLKLDPDTYNCSRFLNHDFID